MMNIWATIGFLLILFFIAVIWSACVISGRISRLEEQREMERNLPPDG